MRVAVQAHRNVLSVLDYKSLYEETQQRLDETRVMYQQVEIEISAALRSKRAVEDQLGKAHLRIQHLEFECQAAKVQDTRGLRSNQDYGDGSGDNPTTAATLLGPDIGMNLKTSSRARSDRCWSRYSS
jgi:hypothetical protein